MGEDKVFTFYLNHSEKEVCLEALKGKDLFTGEVSERRILSAGEGMVLVRELKGI